MRRFFNMEMSEHAIVVLRLISQRERTSPNLVKMSVVYCDVKLDLYFFNI